MTTSINTSPISTTQKRKQDDWQEENHHQEQEDSSSLGESNDESIHSLECRDQPSSPPTVSPSLQIPILKKKKRAPPPSSSLRGKLMSDDSGAFSPRSSSTRFCMEAVEVLEVPKLQSEEFSTFFYDDDEIAQFRHEAWVEECGLDPAIFL